MSADNSTKPSAANKPAKPSPDYPLFPHATGRWAKKIKGRLVYFGPWNDAAGALKRYQDFQAGKPVVKAPRPRRSTDAPGKPPLPYDGYPLFAHANGQWAKKVRGEMHYFGSWDDPQAALNKYQKEREALENGRKPREETEGLTLHQLCNKFIAEKTAFMSSGELSPLTLRDYKSACKEMLAAFGKTRVVDDIRADDFSQLRVRLSRKWGKHRLAKTIQFTRCVFKWAFDSELIDRTVRFGPGFKKPSRKVMRQHRRTQGQKMFTPDEIHALLGKASTQLRAMILLGINAAYGNSDCGNLPRSALDLENGWATFPRPKTEADRRAPLWAETVQAIEQALAERPEPKNPEHKDLVFVTRCGDSWFKPTPDGPISREFGKLLRALKINGRAGLGFYSLRHTHRTIADEVKDQPAAARIMGHAADGNDMSDSYREYIADERLRAITDHVRSWLFAKQPTENTTEPRAIIPMSTAKVS